MFDANGGNVFPFLGILSQILDSLLERSHGVLVAIFVLVLVIVDVVRVGRETVGIVVVVDAVEDVDGL